MIWAGGRGGGTSHPGLALGKFLTHRLAGENRRFFKHPGKSECVSDLHLIILMQIFGLFEKTPIFSSHSLPEASPGWECSDPPPLSPDHNRAVTFDLPQKSKNASIVRCN